jgi:hypothetical protein
MLPYFIKHYRDRFPSCEINIYDNYSTDKSEIIAINNNCNVIKYDTNNKLSDSTYLKIKNNEWKKSINNDWVLVCDVDEFLDINIDALLYEQKNQTTLIKGTAYDMINMNYNEVSIENMKYGVRSFNYDKTYLFNKQFVKDINYLHGCHSCRPVGKLLKYNNTTYNLYHMSYVSEDYKIRRYISFKERMSDENKKYGWGIQYLNDEQNIKNDFSRVRSIAKKII